MKSSMLILVGLLVISIVSGMEYETDANTIVLYHFNEGVGQAVFDSSDNDVLATLSDSGLWGEGVYESAIDLEPYDYAQLQNNGITNLGDNDFTIEAWIKTPTDGMIISKVHGSSPYPGYEFRIINGKLQLSLVDTTGGPSVTNGVTRVDDDQWHHVAATRENNIFSLYIDGNLDNNNINNIGNLNNNLGARIGLRGNGNVFPYTGKIDEFRLSNIARTEFNLEMDHDNDGIIDIEDNCNTIWNPAQRDQDQDGVGDWCDNCIFKRNADQEDSDEDTIGDACEGLSFICYVDKDNDPLPLEMYGINGDQTQ